MAAEIAPRSRAAWRAWLDKNHSSATEIFLIFYKKGAGRPTLSYNDAVEEALCFGWIDGVKRRLDDERYTHRFTPRRPASKWSALNRERVKRVREAGLMTPAGELAIKAAVESGGWSASDRRPAASIEMPEELAKRLKRDKQADRFFASLTPREQRLFIGWINAAKREETKARRINETMRRLQNGEKLGMV